MSSVLFLKSIYRIIFGIVKHNKILIIKVAKSPLTVMALDMPNVRLLINSAIRE
jgi:hypothetical protein